MDSSTHMKPLMAISDETASCNISVHLSRLIVRNNCSSDNAETGLTRRK